MAKPTIQYRTKIEKPGELLLLAIQDGANTVILAPDEAAAIYQELGRILHQFGQLPAEGSAADAGVAD